jgi:hypothetical protein
MVIDKREFVLGTRDYELSVREEPGGYYGAWFCRACHQGGVKYALSPSIERAFTAAMVDAEKHESEKHGPS